MEQAQRLTQVRGAAAAGIDLCVYSFFSFLSFPVCSGLSLSFHLSAGMKGSGGGALPSSRLARRRRGYQVLSYSNQSAYSMNKTKTKTRESSAEQNLQSLATKAVSMIIQ